MYLRKLRVHNYKSLRELTFEPSRLSCLVGPNAAGKTNLTDALHFLSEAYRHGLEVAIARKGGYENIAYRRKRRSKAPIEFEIIVDADAATMDFLLDFDLRGRAHIPEQSELRFRHKFVFGAKAGRIKADFEVLEDELSIEFRQSTRHKWREVYSIRLEIDAKTGNRTLGIGDPSQALEPSLFQRDFNFLGYLRDLTEREQTPEFSLPAQSLVLDAVPFSLLTLRQFTSFVGGFQVFRLSPALSRSPGVPTPNPHMSAVGENLPALVDWLKHTHPREWESVIQGMQDVMPTLVDIDTQYLHTKTLGLVFEEDGVGRRWTASDVSDGTIQALAMLVASADPRSTLLLIEELENSIHPWVIKTVMKRMRAISQAKNVVITTHSPVVVDLFEPKEVWVVYRHEGETKIGRVSDLSPEMEKDWREGKYRVSDFLDSGLLPHSVPGGVL